MSKAVIVKVVLCEGCRFGDVLTVYYASGRTHDYVGSYPYEVMKWCANHTLVADMPKGSHGHYCRWE